MLYNGLFIAFGVLLLPHYFDGTGSWGRGKVNTSLQRSLMGFRFLSVGATSILGVPDLNEHIISCHICSSQYLKTCCKGSHWGPLDAEHTKRRSFLTAESYDERLHPFSWNSPWPIVEMTERFLHGSHFGQSWSLKHNKPRLCHFFNVQYLFKICMSCCLILENFLL